MERKLPFGSETAAGSSFLLPGGFSTPGALPRVPDPDRCPSLWAAPAHALDEEEEQVSGRRGGSVPQTGPCPQPAGSRTTV